MNAIRFTQIFARIYILIVQTFKLIEFYQPTYNPNGLRFIRNDAGRRPSTDRYYFMMKHLPKSGISSYLDAGCQIGYFNFLFAEKKNVISHGFDLEPIVIGFARAITAANQLRNVSFWQQDLTPETAEALPKYDVISVFSLYHHLAHFQGRKAADTVMERLFERCNYLVFETGQHGEPNQYWSDSLDFMGSDVVAWFGDYCKKYGFEVIAHQEFGNHLNARGRTTFVAKRS